MFLNGEKGQDKHWDKDILPLDGKQDTETTNVYFFQNFLKDYSGTLSN